MHPYRAYVSGAAAAGIGGWTDKAVTGGTGFLGGYMVARLEQAGARVTAKVQG